MIWLEIISVRTAGAADTSRALQLCGQIHQTMTTDRPEQVMVFCSALYDTDFSIHLRWGADPGPGGKSALGLEMSSALSDFGLVNHTIWTERMEWFAGRHPSRRNPGKRTRKGARPNGAVYLV